MCMYIITIPEFSAAPVIIGSPQNETRLEGDVAMFNCSAEAEPLYTVQWFFQDIILPAGGPKYIIDDVINITYGRLTVRDVNQNDTGSYTCVVNNTHGNASASAYLYVQGQYQKLYLTLLCMLIIVFLQ